ncbi:MAG TPA: cysteine synthase family protein [Candidatus Polarisedimenticolaceae bacterium]|nr:cysteine synthase family protein [Candidatus Polarisedimenticolaceae bacterium]
MDRSLEVYDDILDLLPDVDHPTPLVRINRLNPSPSFTLYAKLEWLNPFGSVKDRAAAYLVRDLERRGQLSATRGVVEPTSGNTGLSLAGMCAARGYRVRAVVPNKVPLEKKVLLRIAGADLDVVNDELCPSPGMGEGSINFAKSRAKAQGDVYALPNQYENEENARAHYETTAPEIWRQTEGRITHLFVSLGTCGTVTGCARFLRERNPRLKVIAVQPTEGHDVPGLRNVAQLDVSKLFDPSLIDEILEIDFELAYTRALDLARREGLMAGPSSGLIYEGARRIVERDREGVGVMVFADNVFKYVTNMVKHVPELAEGTSA